MWTTQESRDGITPVCQRPPGLCFLATTPSRGARKRLTPPTWSTKRGTGEGQVLGTLITCSRCSEQEPPKGKFTVMRMNGTPRAQQLQATHRYSRTCSLVKTPNVHLKNAMQDPRSGAALPGQGFCSLWRRKDQGQSSLGPWMKGL